MKRRQMVVAFGIFTATVVVGVIGLVLVARQMARQTVTVAQAAAVETSTLSEPPRGKRADFVGVLAPPLTVNVSSRVEGKLATVDAMLGQVVKAGEPLAALDSRLQEHDVAMAKASFRAARAASAAARVEVSRARDHLARRQESSITVGNSMLAIVSGEEAAQAGFDKEGATAKFLSSTANAVQEQKQFERASSLLDEHSLRAPFDCVVAARYLDPGTYVKPGDPVVRIVATGAMLARFAVPEDRIAGVHVSDPVRIDIGTEKSIAGRVERISPEVEPSSRLVVVEAKAEGEGSTCQSDCAGVAGRVVRVTIAKAQ